ncbi:MAG: DUF4982 domain-containing protein [Duncaniella sp.]|nr:DUF4982 domain-containing protein [Duncaniella sp.]
MKNFFLFLMPLLISSVAWGMPRDTENFNFDWKFSRADIPVNASPDTDDSAWETVNLPHDFLISQPWVEPAADEKADLNNSVANVKSRLSSRAFKEMGTGWYRKTFIPKPEWEGRRVLLDFEGIMLNGDVYFNGEKVGGTDYGYLGFETDITDLLKYGEPNVVAVRASTGAPENSRWYTGGGLYRDVKIVTTDKDTYFARHPLYITTPSVTKDSAVVALNAEITFKPKRPDYIRTIVEISDPEGRMVYSDTASVKSRKRPRTYEYVLDSILILNPSLWDVDSPSLYTASVRLLRNDGTVADSVASTFGIRSVEFSPEFGMKLNGKKILLKGIANHHTLGALGAAAYPAAIEKRIKMLKDYGFNHIRTSHNPYSEEFLNLCDRYGILVVDELYDKWLRQYAGGRREWMEQWPGDVSEWVKRDRNHPSVVIWSLGNELQTLSNLPFNDWGVTAYKLQKTLLERFDRTRPVTVAMHPRGRNLDTDSLPAPLVLETDIAAYNYRYMYFPGDSRRYPWMMFYQSEANTSGMGPNYFDMDLDKVIGLAYWGMIDYLGESAGWPAKGWNQGVFDISLQPKPMAAFLKSYFREDEPVVGIGIIESDDKLVWNDVNVGTLKLSHHWNRQPGDTVTLYTFTNADEVELIVNGRSLGRRNNDREKSSSRNRILWENIPFAGGAVEARAYNTGDKKAIAVDRIETTGKAVSLKAEADKTVASADGMDLIHVNVTAVDSKGRVVPDADGLVTFTVEGPAEIAGVINGDINSHESMTGNERSLHEGRCSVILRTSRVPGNVTLHAVSPSLKPASVKVSLPSLFRD